MLKMMLCLAILLAVGHVCALEPGIKLRITNKGLNYVKDLAIRQLQEDPSKFFPTMYEGQRHGVRWIFQDIQYTNFNVTDSAVETNNALNFDLWLSELSVSMDGRISSGSRTTNIDRIKLTDLHLNLQLNSDLDRNDTPVVYLDACNFTFGDLVLGYAGGSYQVYNALTTTYSFYVRQVLTREACDSLRTLVEQINGRFQWVDNYTGIVYDYSLTAPLNATNQYIESQHRGEYKMTTSESSPYTPAPMPDIQENDAMFYLMVNEYVVKTAMFALAQSYRLGFKLEPEQLSETYKSLLMSVIDWDVSDNNMKTPNIELAFHSRSTPDVNFTKSGINITFYGVVVVSIDAAFVDLVYFDSKVLHREVNATFVITPAIQNNTLVTLYQQPRIQFGEYYTNLERHQVTLLSEGLEQEFLSNLWVPFIEAQSRATDHPLPLTLVNPKIVLEEGFLMLATDISAP